MDVDVASDAERSEVLAGMWKLMLLLITLAPAGIDQLIGRGEPTTRLICPCAYARLAGIERAMPCSEDFQDVTTQDLFAVKWPEAVKVFATQHISG